MKAKFYIKSIRMDHWFKNIFMLPGIFFAISKINIFTHDLIYDMILAVLSTCFAASANYVLNEFLDADYDKYHPSKKHRPLVQEKFDSRIIFCMYFSLITISLYIASFLKLYFFGVTILFIVMGIFYNVKPFRTKDLPYLDVLSESINNPIRLTLGWLCIIKDDFSIPISLIIGYWMAGAFLMSMKRYAELRTIGSVNASLYRKSFKYYSEKKLLISTSYYAMTSTLFLGVFLIKYHISLILSFPFISLLFVWYLSIGLENNSIVQTPEKLFGSKIFLLYLLFLSTLLYALTNFKYEFLNVFI